MTIWWCEEHNVSAFKSAPLIQMLCWEGWDIWCQSRGEVDPDCRMVKMRLNGVDE